MHSKFAKKFSSQWIKVKFYDKEPNLKGVTKPNNVRFCEVVNMAITQPIILTKEQLSCESASYIFGWKDKLDSKLLDCCQDKCKIGEKILQSLIASIPRFKKQFTHIGLNTDADPDLVMACVKPEEMMRIIKIYNNHNGKNVDVGLNSMMGLCGNIAAKTFLEEKINVSFGCLDSRKYADIGSDRLVVGIPKKLFKIFIS